MHDDRKQARHDPSEIALVTPALGSGVRAVCHAF
jgi:hypothetical protein